LWSVFAEGSQVKLLARIAGYPAGTEAVVVGVRDDVTCEVELAAGRRFLIGINALSKSGGPVPDAGRQRRRPRSLVWPQPEWEDTTLRKRGRELTRCFERRLCGYTLGTLEPGPIQESVVADLEALKWRLAAMDSPDELPADQAAALGAEISAIRLHLKRLDFDRLRNFQRPS
jgi:hypothetical protein